jgi:hypothetical protein
MNPLPASHRSSRFGSLVGLLAALLVALLVGCSGGGGGGSSFTVRTTTNPVDPESPIIVGGNWLVYLAFEPLAGTGTDLNGDGDTDDHVAVAVKLSKSTETVLEVAAVDGAIIEDEIYLVVDEEEDDHDWSGANGTEDLVLLHWSLETETLVFVDTLDPESEGVSLLVVGDFLFYASESDPTPGSDETSLRRIDPALPTTGVIVENTIGGGILHPTLLGDDSGLVFLLLDESVEGGDLNGDADSDDEYVLALLNGTDDDERIVTVGLAVADEDAPFAAYATDRDDWLVAFLVNEADQGGVSLNPLMLDGQTINPDSCNVADVDSDDDVLHFLEYEDFLLGAAPENTGLVGRDRVIVVEDYVATLSLESDAGCDINEDGDPLDTVVRWTGIDVVMPRRLAAQLLAVDPDVPGGSFGFAALEDRFVAIIDEAQDSANHDGKPGNHDLVAWLDPADGFTGALWTFAHESSNENWGTGIAGEPYAGASWMADEEEGGRLALAFQEEVPNLNLNNFSLDCDALTKDGDRTDSLPIWLDFENGPVLDFDGVGFALSESNAGIVVAGGYAFFRVSEIDDATDYNLDGDTGDVILMRNPLAACAPKAMATSHPQFGPVIVTEFGARGAAFLCSELLAGLDLNDDGDSNDTLVRYFRF